MHDVSSLPEGVGHLRGDSKKIRHVGGHRAGPGERGAIPIQRDGGGVERMAGEEQAFRKLRCPAGAYEFQIAFRRGAVDFVADDWMAGVGNVDADLVGATGDRLGGQQRETVSGAFDF